MLSPPTHRLRERHSTEESRKDETAVWCYFNKKLKSVVPISNTHSIFKTICEASFSTAESAIFGVGILSNAASPPTFTSKQIQTATPPPPPHPHYSQQTASSTPGAAFDHWSNCASPVQAAARTGPRRGKAPKPAGGMRLAFVDDDGPRDRAGVLSHMRRAPTTCIRPAVHS